MGIAIFMLKMKSFMKICCDVLGGMRLNNNGGWCRYVDLQCKSNENVNELV